jgi:ELWxxDGT repeat protein
MGRGLKASGSSPYGYPYSSFPGELTAVGGTLYFAASDGEHGVELWVSDRTAAGTALVADIRPGRLGSNPSYLAFVNGALFFAADDGQTGVEP